MSKIVDSEREEERDEDGLMFPSSSRMCSLSYFQQLEKKTIIIMAINDEDDNFSSVFFTRKEIREEVSLVHLILHSALYNQQLV